MDRENKEKFVADLHERLKKVQGTLLVGYQGLDVEATNRLRRELGKVEAEFQVVKNRLLKLASENTDTAVVKDYMRGPSAIALMYEDVVGPSKVLVDYAKEFKQLEIRRGQISGREIDVDGIRKLAVLPPRDVLLAQTLSVMQAVPTAFVRVLNAVTVSLLNVLKAIEEQKAN
ncbi:MAG TPA: 50S ribosomal protein L10 [Deltaproteobacteria bacterium]|nr:50S ribosomal protein L10 [Deltaproteobacteria bacterium]